MRFAATRKKLGKLADGNIELAVLCSRMIQVFQATFARKKHLKPFFDALEKRNRVRMATEAELIHKML